MKLFKKVSWFNVITFLVALALYIIPSFFFKIDKEYYYSLEGPHLPPIVFIIVWSVIYVLMSIFIAYYVDLYKKDKNKSLIKLFVFFGINYLFNIMYVPFFFLLKELFLSFVICILIFISILFVAMESLIYNKKFTLITLPYIIWSAVGTILAMLFYLQN